MDLTGKTIRRYENKELNRNKSENSIIVGEKALIKSSRKLFNISKNSSFINKSTEDEIKQGKKQPNINELKSCLSLTNLFDKSSDYKKKSPFSAKRNESCNNIFKPIENFESTMNRSRNGNNLSSSKSNKYNEMNFVEHYK